MTLSVKLQVMDVLKKSLPKELRPYTLLDSKVLHQSDVTALTFRGLTDIVVSGSKDCQVSISCSTDAFLCLVSQSIIAASIKLLRQYGQKTLHDFLPCVSSGT